MPRTCREGLAFAFVAVVAGALGGCQSSEPTAEWKSWTYQEREALTTAQQFERARACRNDGATLTEGPLGVPAEIPSNMLSEQERRAIQEGHARALRDRVREQRLAAEATGQQAERVGRGGQAAGSRE